MLSATGIIRTVDKLSIVTTFLGGGRGMGWGNSSWLILQIVPLFLARIEGMSSMVGTVYNSCFVKGESF